MIIILVFRDARCLESLLKGWRPVEKVSSGFEGGEYVCQSPGHVRNGIPDQRTWLFDLGPVSSVRAMPQPHRKQDSMIFGIEYIPSLVDSVPSLLRRHPGRVCCGCCCIISRIGCLGLRFRLSKCGTHVFRFLSEDQHTRLFEMPLAGRLPEPTRGLPLGIRGPRASQARGSDEPTLCYIYIYIYYTYTCIYIYIYIHSKRASEPSSQQASERASHPSIQPSVHP